MSGATGKTRVLYIVSRFNQLSESYITSELNAVDKDYEVRVTSLAPADWPRKTIYPYELVKGKPERLLEIAQEFKPHVIHTHYVTNFQYVAPVAAKLGVGFTCRAHSFDCTPVFERQMAAFPGNCIAVLAFPYARKFLTSKGIPDSKLIDTPPVVDVPRFRDRSPNGDAILNLGAALPKKRYEDYIDLAAAMPGKEFNLYTVGYLTEKLKAYNAQRGHPARFHDAVEYEEMLPIYKRHRWLVYTACPMLKTVGWPVVVAEAQASGVGVCVPSCLPSVFKYLGGAGFVFSDLREVPKILSMPYPEEMRELGFKVAERSDINVHKKLLTDLWDKCA